MLNANTLLNVWKWNLKKQATAIRENDTESVKRLNKTIHNIEKQLLFKME